MDAGAGRKGRYDVGAEVLAKIQAVFGCDWADDAKTMDTINEVYGKTIILQILILL